MAAVMGHLRSNPQVEAAGQWVLQRKRQFLTASQWILLGLGLGFCITTFDASGKCYVVPCITGTMAAMYKVNSGMSFQVLVTGFLFILQPAYGLWFMRVRCTEHVAGMYIGASAFTIIMALLTAVLWSDYSDMISSMEDWEREGNTVVTNRALRPTFSALSHLSTGFCVVGAANVVLLTMTRELWSDWHELDDFGGEIGDGSAPPLLQHHTGGHHTVEHQGGGHQPHHGRHHHHHHHQQQDKASRLNSFHGGSAYQGVSSMGDEFDDDDNGGAPGALSI